MMRHLIVAETHKGIARELIALRAVSDSLGASAFPEAAVAAENTDRVSLTALADQIIRVHTPLPSQCLDRTRGVCPQHVASTAVEPARRIVPVIQNHSSVPPGPAKGPRNARV